MKFPAAVWFVLLLAARTVTLTWEDASNPAGTTYNVYRGSGKCATNPLFVPIAQMVPAMGYVDSSISIPGDYCYRVTAVFGGLESPPSNMALAVVRPFPPGAVKSK